jgi:hypothetical protein
MEKRGDINPAYTPPVQDDGNKDVKVAAEKQAAIRVLDKDFQKRAADAAAK